MTVSAAVYNSANTGAAIASTDVTSGGYDHGLLAASASDPLNRDTEIAIEVHREHPSASAFTVGRVVRIIDDDGEVTKFEITEVDDHIVAGDNAGETVRISGRTLLAQWRNAKMRPHAVGLESQDVAYNFAYPGLSTSAWTDSVVHVDRTSFGWTRPIGWADPYTDGVWDATNTTGTIFGRRQFTTSGTTKVVGYVSADDGFSVWLDGVRLGRKFAGTGDTEPVWYRPYRALMVELGSGTHTLAIEAHNSAGTGTVWATLWPTDGLSLSNTGPILMTGPSSVTTEPVGTWEWLSYPATRPAPPCTQIVVDFLARAQADSAMQGWTLGFTGSADSDSVAPSALEWSIGQSKSGFDMLESLVEAGWLTFRVRPGSGKVLDAYVTYGTDTGLSHVGSDQVDLRTKVSM